MEYSFDEAIIEGRRKELRLSVKEVCRRAKVAKSTYYRLTAGGTVKERSVQRIIEVLDLTPEEVAIPYREPKMMDVLFSIFTDKSE